MDEEQNKLTHIMDGVRDVSLSGYERESIKTRIRLFMATNPVQVPLYIRLLDSLFGLFDTTAVVRWGIPMRSYASAALLLLVVGVGTSYASQNALPGDTLYPMKIRVNEPVQGILALSTEDKVKWNATLTDRRLGEAELLASEGRLTPELSNEIESNINSSTDGFNTHVALLSTVPSNDLLIADVQSNLEASLNAHENVLSSLESDLPSTSQSIMPILASVRSHAKRARADRTKTEATLESQNTPEIQMAARERKRVAEGQIQEAKTRFVHARTSPEATSSQDVAASVSDVQQAIDEGDKKLQAGKFGSAFGTFQAAIRVAQEVKLGADARSKLQDIKHFRENNVTSINPN